MKVWYESLDRGSRSFGRNFKPTYYGGTLEGVTNQNVWWWNGPSKSSPFGVILNSKIEKSGGEGHF